MGNKNRMIPLAKQSKSKQREYYAARRGSWNGVNPVCRIVPNGKAYGRNRMKRLMKKADDSQT